MSERINNHSSLIKHIELITCDGERVFRHVLKPIALLFRQIVAIGFEKDFVGVLEDFWLKIFPQRGHVYFRVSIPEAFIVVAVTSCVRIVFETVDQIERGAVFEEWAIFIQCVSLAAGFEIMMTRWVDAIDQSRIDWDDCSF